MCKSNVRDGYRPFENLKSSLWLKLENKVQKDIFSSERQVNKHQNIQSFACGFWQHDLEKSQNLPGSVFSLVKGCNNKTSFAVKVKCIKVPSIVSDTRYCFKIFTNKLKYSVSGGNFLFGL